MIWILVIAMLLVVIAWYVGIRRQRAKKPPDASYVCDVCGEKDCDCHKVDP